VIEVLVRRQAQPAPSKEAAMRTRTLVPALLALAATNCTSSTPDHNPGGLAGAAPISMQPPAGTAGSTPVQMNTAGATGMVAQPTAGVTGTAGMAGMGMAGMGGGAAPTAGAGGTTSMEPMMAFPDPRGGCPDLNSGFPDDRACIAPPAPGEGMQIHIGPTDYKDPAQINKHRFAPGMESSECWSFHTPNQEKIYYQSFVISGRAGTHHIINSMYMSEVTDGGFTICKDPGTGSSPDLLGNLPGASKAFMPRTIVAPENAKIGRSIGPKTPSQADMHYFNFTQSDLLREFWMNIYFVPKESVEQEATQIRAMGGLSWTVLPIAPGTDNVYKYECPITADGRILALLGHYHAHGKRFTAHIRRAGGTREKVFEMYDYLDPATFPFNTVVQNPMFTNSTAGAVSGILNVKAGDVMEWECHIINDSQVGLTYTNEVKTGEMCNLWGSSYGIMPLNCVLP
jgi:hypothetical protein